MATTLQNFVRLAVQSLVGATVQPAGAVLAMNPSNATQVANGGSGIVLDRPTIDLSKQGYAKNGAVAFALTGTTPQAVSLQDLTGSGTLNTAGDTAFATWNQLVLVNTGAADVTVAPAGSNGARLLLAGTGPTLTVPANSTVTLASLAGLAVDSTHYGITVTPTASGSFAICVGGA